LHGKDCLNNGSFASRYVGRNRTLRGRANR
jgi:hypothetical protein